MLSTGKNAPANSALTRQRNAKVAWFSVLGVFVAVHVSVRFWQVDEYGYALLAFGIALALAVVCSKRVQQIPADERGHFDDQRQSAHVGLIIAMILAFFAAPMIVLIWWYLFDRK